MKPSFLICLSLISQGIASVEYMGNCEEDSHCFSTYSPKYFCIEKRCRHTSLDITSLKEIVGIILLLIISGLTNAGGIGGGAVIVPVYLFSMEYSIGDSVPLAKATIFGGAIVTLFANINRRKLRDPSQPLNDYRIASFIVPLMLSGSLIGVMLTKIVPSAVILFFMVTYLMTSSYQIFFKAVAYSRKENETKKKKVIQTIEDTPEKNKYRLYERTPAKELPRSIQELEEDHLVLTRPVEDAPELSSILKPFYFNISMCIFSYLVILIVAVLRGGKGFKSLVGITYCSSTSFLILIFGEITCITIALLICFKEKLDFAPKPININTETKEDSEITQESSNQLAERVDSAIIFSKTTILTCAKIYFGGMLADMIGIGGGVVVNPLLLTLGYSPEIAATISGFVVLFTSLSTSTQFLIAGAYDFKNSISILAFSIIGSYFGKRYVDKVVEKLGRPSLLVWILFFITVISAFVLPGVGILKIIHEESPFSIGHICEA